MAIKNNIFTFGGHSPEKKAELRAGFQGTVNACRQALLRFIPLHLSKLFEQMDDVLYELADKSDTNAQQTTYFDALRELRLAKDTLVSNFEQTLVGRMDRFWARGPENYSGKSVSQDAKQEEFSLIEGDELEIDLAISSMVSRGDANFYRELYALDQRFGYLLSGIKIEPAGNPLAPISLGSAFKQAVELLSVPLDVKLVLFKQFERQVVGQLGEFYDEINSILIKASVLPEIKSQSPRRRNNPAVTAKKAKTETSPVSESDVHAGVFATLQQLLGQRRRPFATNSSVPMQYIDSSDVLSALSVLQHADDFISEGGVRVLDAKTLREGLMLVPQFGQVAANGKHIGRTDEDTMDVIAMLFEFILDDPALSDAMRALLARLQIPMLKVAILDKAFFSKKEHPARRLLNTMAQAAVGWTEVSGRSGDSLYGRIDAIVSRILNEFDDDMSLFEELNEQFGSYLDSEAKGAAVAEERAAQVTKGKEALAEARGKALDEINSRLSQNPDVPTAIREFIRDGWKDVMTLTHLRQGRDSEAWLNVLGLLDTLLWSLEAKRSPAERQKLLKAIPELLKGIRTSLVSISYDQHKMASAFKALQACHLRCLRGKAPQDKDLQDSLASPTPMDAAMVAAAGDAAVEEIVVQAPQGSGDFDDDFGADEFDRMADELKVGAWLELQEMGGNRTRAKLSWRSAISGNCLFVNRKGMKVSEMTPHGLAAWFRSGKAKVLGAVEVPLIDRALDAVVTQLDSAKADTKQ